MNMKILIKGKKLEIKTKIRAISAGTLRNLAPVPFFLANKKII